MRYAVPLGLCLALSPLMSHLAQGQSDGLGLIQEGSRQLFNDFMGAIEPGLRELREGLSQPSPSEPDVFDLMPDPDLYEAPRKLPNGDILIRRKPQTDEIDL